MIIYGYTTKVIETPILSHSCGNCETMNLMIYTAKKIFKLYYVPCFPYSTVHEIFCTQCGTKHANIQFNLESYKIKTPKKYFSGLIFFSIIFGSVNLSMYYDTKHKQTNTQKYSEKPLTNDLYIIKDPKSTDFPYHIFKVTDVETHKINFLIYKNAYKKLSDATKNIEFRSHNDYGTEEFHINKKDMKELDIQEIKRFTP